MRGVADWSFRCDKRLAYCLDQRCHECGVRKRLEYSGERAKDEKAANSSIIATYEFSDRY